MPGPTITEQLGEPFDAALLREHPGKHLTYVPISEVVARLNRVLGVNGWGYEIQRVWEAGAKETPNGVYPVWIMAHVRLTTILVDISVSAVDGIGGQKVKMLNSGEGPVDLGDEYKGAVSDALKKAAQHLGVGLELARKDEALAYEERASAPPPAPPDGFETMEGAKSRYDTLKANHGLLAPPDREAFDQWKAEQNFPPFPWPRLVVEMQESEIARIRAAIAKDEEPF